MCASVTNVGRVPSSHTDELDPESYSMPLLVCVRMSVRVRMRSKLRVQVRVRMRVVVKG